MQIQKLQKSWRIFLSIIIVFVIINIMIIVWYIYPNNSGNHRENFVAGRVSGISSDFITTIDINHVTKSFAINEQTKYIAGRQTITKNDIQLNNLVFIIPIKNSTSTSVAGEVRVLKNNDKPLPHN